MISITILIHRLALCAEMSPILFFPILFFLVCRDGRLNLYFVCRMYYSEKCNLHWILNLDNIWIFIYTILEEDLHDNFLRKYDLNIYRCRSLVHISFFSLFTNKSLDKKKILRIPFDIRCCSLISRFPLSFFSLSLTSLLLQSKWTILCSFRRFILSFFLSTPSLFFFSFSPGKKSNELVSVAVKDTRDRLV